VAICHDVSKRRDGRPLAGGRRRSIRPAQVRRRLFDGGERSAVGKRELFTSDAANKL